MWVTSLSEAPAPFLAYISEVSESAPRVMPWKQPMKAKMLLLPVFFLASLMAASTPLVPVGPQNWIL